MYFYYGLINYYQNHRRYVKSRDDNQLLGKTDRVATECQPYQKTSNGSDIDLTPCGAIANSRFNGLWVPMDENTTEGSLSLCLDTLDLSFNGTLSVPVTNLGIAWSTDKAVKFKNPPNPQNCNQRSILNVRTPLLFR